MRISFATYCSGPLLVVGSFFFGGCEKPKPPQPPPTTVTIANPVQREVIEWDTFTGHLEAPESVTVSARVSGLVMETPFVEGSLVKKGDVLFVIDDRPFKADIDARRADEQKAAAQLTIAQLNLDRQEQALKGNAVSQQDFDNAKATRDQGSAAVGAAKAATELAQLNLEWCKVTSPITGRVSNKMVTVGNLVNGGAGQATTLTSVQSVDPMYCYVDVDEHSVLKYQQLSVEKKRVSARDAKIPCFVQLGNETGFPHQGVVDFVDNHVDPSTGTLRARGVLKNANGMLTPGFFASMRIPGSGRYQTLLVPDTAIGTDQSRRTVMVVNKDDTIEVRVVGLGESFGALRSVTSGLDPEDRVVINGMMKARPGSKVAPTPGKIEVDPKAFADPDSPTTQELPATTPTSDSTLSPAAGTTR